MKTIIQTLAFLITLSVAVSPVMAKDDTSSPKKPKAKTTETKKPKAKKVTEKKPAKKDTEKKVAKKASDKAGGSKATKAAKAKKPVKSKLTATDKAKKFKDIIVNINKADAETFAYYLVGIGEKRANAIVKQRKTAKFKNIEELKQVEGIGEAIYDGIRKNVSISKGETSVPKEAKATAKKPVASKSKTTAKVTAKKKETKKPVSNKPKDKKSDK